jgi:hypothetical protein
MRARVLGMALLLLTAAATAAWAEDSAPSPENEPFPRTAAAAHRPMDAPNPAVPLVFHRQNTFAIPFAVNQNSPAPVDVILYASSDLGATWDFYARQPTAQKQFVFRAARDGEYWFTSQLVAAGLAPPNALGLGPQLKIIVDTQPPRLTLDVKSEPSGMVHVVWEAHDEALVPDKLTLNYQTNPGQAWKPLETERSAADALRQTLRGETRFQPERGAALVSVRLEAKDSADNIAELTRRLFLPLSITSAFGAAPAPQATSDVPADPFARHGFPPTDPAQQQTDLALPPPPSGAAGQPERTEQPSGNAWPSQNPEGNSWQPSSVQYQPSSGSAGSPVAREAVASAQSQTYSVSDDGQGASDGRETAGQADTAYAPLTNDQSADAASGPPAGERPRMTNAKRFNLDYSIDAVGPQGVEKVELWVTRNGGQDWTFWTADEDRESPLLVEVEEEGIYGFRIVIVGKNGLTSQSPRPGDPADLWVGVDTTTPVAEIVSAAYGKDQYAGHLDIRWTATDSGFGARPVTLLFSDRRQGPWTTIASGLPNTGQYYWRVDSRVPDQFYLRMEVRDEAGNLCVAELDEPIRSAGLTPRGRIRNVEPAAN